MPSENSHSVQPIELPIANVNSEVEMTIRAMRAVYDLYNSLPLKDIEQAKQDTTKIKVGSINFLTSPW